MSSAVEPPASHCRPAAVGCPLAFLHPTFCDGFMCPRICRMPEAVCRFEHEDAPATCSCLQGVEPSNGAAPPAFAAPIGPPLLEPLPWRARHHFHTARSSVRLRGEVRPCFAATRVVVAAGSKRSLLCSCHARSKAGPRLSALHRPPLLQTLCARLIPAASMKGAALLLCLLLAASCLASGRLGPGESRRGCRRRRARRRCFLGLESILILAVSLV